VIKGLLRRLIREGLEDMRREWADYLANLITRNNEKIEEDLIQAGVLERGEDGQLHAKTR